MERYRIRPSSKTVLFLALDEPGDLQHKSDIVKEIKNAGGKLAIPGCFLFLTSDQAEQAVLMIQPMLRKGDQIFIVSSDEALKGVLLTLEPDPAHRNAGEQP